MSTIELLLHTDMHSHTLGFCTTGLFHNHHGQSLKKVAPENVWDS